MGKRKRQRIEPTDDWQQLHLLTTSAEQHLYELIRPIVLFGHSPAERARQTGAAERTLYRQSARFEAEGMASLFATPTPSQRRTLPPEMRQAIRELYAEYPAFRPHELATICAARFGRRPSPHTVKRILAEEPPLVLLRRRYPPYHDMAEAAERRLAVIRLHSEGWNIKSIAGYLGIDRHTVYAILRRWIDEGVLGLDDKSRARKPGVRKVDLQAMAMVRELQENPELGAFRIHAALKQVGIELSPRTCGRILALNRTLYGFGTPPRTPHVPKEMPFKATRRHQYWTVDIRYLDHSLDERNVYCISILDNYSRAMLASVVSRKQDLTAYLMVLYAAIRQHGAPEALVSDGGGVFRATQAQRIYAALGIRKEQIDRRQAWQSYIETQFNVQRRMADWHFAQATSWLELLAAHDRWAVDFNYQVHWAHRERQDGRHSPVEVLDWVHGRHVPPEELHRIFYATRFGRTLNRFGYVRFRHWRLYGERGLAGEAAVVWLYREQLTVAFADEALAHYHVTYQPDDRHLASVTAAELLETPYRSPQLPLWECGDGEWLAVVRVAPYTPRPPRQPPAGIQRRLFPDEDAAAATG
jgi:putative transposase